MTLTALPPAAHDAPQLFEIEAYRADRPDTPADVVPFFAASLDAALAAGRQILADAGARWGNLLADGRDITVIEVA